MTRPFAFALVVVALIATVVSMNSVLGRASAVGLLGIADVQASQPPPSPNGAAPTASPADAESFWRKVQLIEQRAQTRSAKPARTPVSEAELNAYLALKATPDLPVGLRQPRVSILGGDRVAGTAVVDLDQVRESRKPRGTLDPWNLLSGRVPVSVAGRLSSEGGSARFALETAQVGSIPVPKSLLQELVSYFSRGPAKPSGINLDDPFPLPAGIKRIEVGRGSAVVVQ